MSPWKRLGAGTATAAILLTLLLSGDSMRGAEAQTAPGSFAAAPVYDPRGLANVVFMGGTVDQLEAAALAAGSNGAWAQDSTGAFQLLIVGGPSFLKDGFKAKFPSGFGVTAITLTRAQASSTPPPTVPSSPPVATAAPSSFVDGTYLVGTDIKPGRYRVSPVDSGCYWERLRGLTGNLSDILANDNASGKAAVVDILESDRAFKTQRCGRWTPATGAVTTSPTADFGDGVYIVGTDIAPGTWRTAGAESCYWQRSRDFTGGLGSILANDNVAGSVVVQILPTDVGFTAHRCGSWSRVQ